MEGLPKSRKRKTLMKTSKEMPKMAEIHGFPAGKPCLYRPNLAEKCGNDVRMAEKWLKVSKVPRF